MDAKRELFNDGKGMMIEFSFKVNPSVSCHVDRVMYEWYMMINTTAIESKIFFYRKRI